MSNGTSYRRGSVFGGLLLISIGGLFLYANLHPEFSPWPLLATWWPLIIIFWGLGKLVDYLLLRGTPEAAAVTRLSAGDIFGLIFLILLGTTFSQIHKGIGWRGEGIRIGGEELSCLFANQYEFSDDVELSVTAPGPFSLTNTRGDIAVRPSTDGRIRIHATKHICATTETEARTLSEKVLPLLLAEGAGYDFHWDLPSGSSGLQRADLKVEVPKGIPVRVSGSRGEVALSGIQTDVTVESERGDVALSDITGNVEMEIRRGDVAVSDVNGSVTIRGRGGEISLSRISGAATLDGEYYGPIQFSAIAGPARFTSRRTTFESARIEGELTVDSGELSLRGVPGDVTLLTRDKEIEIAGVSGAVRVTNRNGRVVVRSAQPPASPIEVENERGSIEIFLPGASGFQITASARKGDITSEFSGLDSQRQREHGPDEILTGSVGNGRASIRLTTSYGTIAIRRSG
ncbi:MAG: DUF4097 family beta strand repeat-containing protein [Candidatus Acidiferrales bacterium]